MSITFKVFETPSICIECRANNYYPFYEVTIVKRGKDGVSYPETYRSYATKQSALSAYYREVAKYRKENNE